MSPFYDIDKYLMVFSESRGAFSGSALHSLGEVYIHDITQRCLVLLVTENTPDFLAIYLALLRRHIAVIILDNRVNRELFFNIVESYRPQYVFLPQGLQGLEAYLSEVNGRFTVKNIENYLVLKAVDYFGIPEIHPDIALLLTTSGSLTLPKMTRLTYANLEDNARILTSGMGLRSSDRFVVTLPPAFAIGNCMINAALYAKSSLILSASSVTDWQFWKTFQEYNGTFFSGTPYLYILLERIHFEDIPCPSLRLMSITGGKITASTRDYLTNLVQQRSLEVLVQYGQTETLSVTQANWNQYLSHDNTIGLPFAETSVTLDEGNKGELICKSSRVFMGYANSFADLAQEDENRGLWRTGDYAVQDDSGYFYITGRIKRFIKLYGFRISLDEYESFFSKMGIETACVGEDENLVIFITDKTAEASVKTLLYNYFSKNLRSVHIQCIRDIPRNHNGKIDYASLIERAGISRLEKNNE